MESCCRFSDTPLASPGIRANWGAKDGGQRIVTGVALRTKGLPGFHCHQPDGKLVH